MVNFITPPFYPLDSVYHSHGVSIDDLAKSRFAPFCLRGEDFSSPPSKMNSDTSTPISGRRAKCPSRLTDFQISRLQLFEMIDKLLADTVVIGHHEKLFTSPSIKVLQEKMFISRK